MNRSALIAVLLTLSLAACGQKADETAQAPAASVAEAPAPAPAIEQAPVDVPADEPAAAPEEEDKD